ncbi:hypothetical protein DXX93_18670 [Thalassotalea euphylliae]|uniref:Uncharacterized protein n=1 Tax=Thalassotalea euphylliae TaxID=1655234 RepID=A0A3E0TVH5_9GAMM|nr:hypothetical protein [Thalassotalea euphylliae]REL28387.1 hypothetical protein DXX93_18670 [Thalassotalea euphylliae]
MNAHFFHPVDDSLAEKAKAFSRVYQEWKNIGASFKYHDQQGWEGMLGSKQELLDAQDTIQNTLNVAVTSFSPEEKVELLQRSLITGDEKDYFESCVDNKASVIQARKDEMQKFRENNTSKRDFDRDKQ